MALFLFCLAIPYAFGCALHVPLARSSPAHPPSLFSSDDQDGAKSDQREGGLTPVWGVEFENNTPLASIIEFKDRIDIQVTAQHVDELAGWIPCG